MVDFLLIAIILAVIGGIVLYLRRAKERGETCIGCPHAKLCGGNCGAGCEHTAAGEHH